MDFPEAEEKFRELQARVQRGEPLTEEQYQEEMQKLMVQDEHGTFWSLDPGSGEWLYFNGTEWVPGTPPRPTGPAAQPEGLPPGLAASEAGGMGAPGAEAYGETPAMEPAAVPTYERAEDNAAGHPGGIAPRPIRTTVLPFGEENSPWLPFAIGAIVLLLCAVALVFGVRNAPFFSSPAAAQVTPTTIVADLATPTVAELPTDTPELAPTEVQPTATASAVTLTMKDRLHVRAGPNTTSKVLDTLDVGTVVTAVGRNADSSWIQVQLPGKTDLGWVINNPEYLTASSDVNALPVADTGAQSAPTRTETPSG
jgi:Bacterial SH3 domain